MAETHVISALVAKRAELSGLYLDLDRQKAKLRDEINHIDHALAIFGYQDCPNRIRAALPKVRRFARRELPRLVREFATEGVPNRDAALAIIAYKGWNAEDRDLVAKVTESVKSAKNWANRKARSGALSR